MDEPYNKNYLLLVENTFQFNKDLIKNYNEDMNIRYFFEVDVKYPKQNECHLKNVKKLKTKKEYDACIWTLKQALNCSLALEKVYRVIKLNQKAFFNKLLWMEI